MRDSSTARTRPAPPASINFHYGDRRSAPGPHQTRLEKLRAAAPEMARQMTENFPNLCPPLGRARLEKLANGICEMPSASPIRQAINRAQAAYDDTSPGRLDALVARLERFTAKVLGEDARTLLARDGIWSAKLPDGRGVGDAYAYLHGLAEVIRTESEARSRVVKGTTRLRPDDAIPVSRPGGLDDRTVAIGKYVTPLFRDLWPGAPFDKMDRRDRIAGPGFFFCCLVCDLFGHERPRSVNGIRTLRRKVGTRLRKPARKEKS